MKDAYTKEQRRAYNQAWAARHKQQHGTYYIPKRNLCECGQPSAVHRGSEWICQRCKDLESRNAQDALSRAIRKDGQTHWDEIGHRIKRMLAIPEWLRNWNNQDAPEGNANPLMLRIESWIEDNGSELVVHGHGEYHLALTTGDCHV